MKNWMPALGALLLTIGCAGAPTAPTVPAVTHDQYLQLKSDATYMEVVAILGSPGKETNHFRFNGVSSDEYTWENPGGGSIKVTFIDNKLDMKSQTLLNAVAEVSMRPVSPTPDFYDVTFEEFERLVEGLTYEQAVEIVGLGGEEVSRSESGGTITIIFSWKNRNGSNMLVTFQGGKLISKAQTGLPVTASPTPTPAPSAAASTAPVTAVSLPSAAPVSSNFGKCWVNGYTRKDGTRVNGYWRTCS